MRWRCRIKYFVGPRWEGISTLIKKIFIKYDFCFTETENRINIKPAFTNFIIIYFIQFGLNLD